MIYVGEHRRISQIRPDGIDLSFNREIIEAIVQSARQHGKPMSYWELGDVRPDLRMDMIGQQRDDLPLEELREFSTEDFEARMLRKHAANAVDLEMKPEDAPMRGSLYDLEPIDLYSEHRLGSGVPRGYLRGTVMLRNDGADPDVLENVERTSLDFDLHSIGSVILHGHINTRRNTQTGFWHELGLDELTPLEPDTNHIVIYEPLGTRQVTALASYVLARLPE